MTTTNENIAVHLPRMAERVPDQAAVIVPASLRGDGMRTYASISFAELERLSNRYANALSSAGIAPGMRTLLMVRPGFDFVALVFALFKVRAVPVMIDPGMGVARLLECVQQVDLDAFVGIPVAQFMRVLRPGAFRSVRQVVTVGRRWCWGGASLARLAKNADVRFQMADTAGSETAAILFSSGSTGPAKGVVYEHAMFGAQVRMIQAQYGIEPGEIDLPTFPLFALFSVAMGMTIVIPDMDPSHPTRVDPERVVSAIRDQKVTSTFGSPAVWKKVAAHCDRHQIKLPTLRRILIAGAPVPYPVIESLHRALPENADVHTPYGATESLPVTSNDGRTLLAQCVSQSRQGAGTCVGLPLPGVQLKIIRITDEPIAVWSDELEVADGQYGEIVVSGPMVTKLYYGLEQATALAKINDGDRLWHRMGDVGYRDAAGRIWFCGRKAHRVTTVNDTLFSIPCEAIFNEHPDVNRSALVGIGKRGHQTPVVVVEPRDGLDPTAAQKQKIQTELLKLGQAHPHTSSIRTFLFHCPLPVDVRHNAKINREWLAKWAEGELN